MNTEAQSRPVILVSRVSSGGDHEKPHLTDLINELASAAKDAIESAGADVITVDGDSLDDVSVALDRADGVVLLGGGDVDPAEYGVTERHPKLYNVDRATDRMDLEIARGAFKRGMPVLAICRGMHIVNVAHGGTLIQHLEETSVIHRGTTSAPMVKHDVTLARASAVGNIFGQATLEVLSGHHQAIGAIGQGLITTASSAEGTVEALESTDGSVPLVAVQWHPEDRHADVTQRVQLFGWLTSQARQFQQAQQDKVF